MKDIKIIKTYIGKDGRVRAYYRDDFNKPHTVSYPRLVLANKLGRPLLPTEDAHHLDENPLNNDPDNLEVIYHGPHQADHSSQYTDVYQICKVCGKTFLWTSKAQANYMSDLRRGKTRAITCSKSCAAKLGRSTQLTNKQKAE